MWNVTEMKREHTENVVVDVSAAKPHTTTRFSLSQNVYEKNTFGGLYNRIIDVFKLYK